MTTLLTNPNVLNYASVRLPKRDDPATCPAPIEHRWDRWGFAFAVVTSLYSIGCFGLCHTERWGFEWLAFGFLGNWVGGAAGLLFSLAAFARDPGRSSPVASFLLNAAVVGAPLAIYFGLTASSQ
jgi:hypothetical protein